MFDQSIEPQQAQMPPDLAAIPRITQPMIRPVPSQTGRTYTAGQQVGGALVQLRVNEDGHWWLYASPGRAATCRGCGMFDDQLDGRCPWPPSQQDVASALLGHLRPAPASMRSHRIRFIRTAVPA